MNALDSSPHRPTGVVMASEVVLFAPVRVEPEIARLFVGALSELSGREFPLRMWFYDDNVDPESSNVLARFVDGHPGSEILPEMELRPTDYSRSGVSHAWSDGAVARVAAIKDAAIERFLATGADRLFLLDADVIVRPDLVEHLLSLDADIVSEVYWTQFVPTEPFLPNVWDFNGYEFDGPDSILRLREPGHHSVGGLGACTMIARRVLEAGVRFEALPNLRVWGEDRHFCIRATALGFELMADTCLPAFHVYRQSLIEPAQEWVSRGMPETWFSQRWLTPGWHYAVKRMVGGSQAVGA